MTIRYVLETVTPERAMVLLDTRKKPNRPQTAGHISMLCNVIRQNLWKVNGDTIKINQLEQMIDGQHRCQAIVETGIAIETWVAYNVPDHVMETLDTHRPRNCADTLTIQGYSNAVASAGTISKLVFFAVGNRSKKLSPSEARILMERHPISESVKAANRSKKNCLFSPSTLGAIHYVGSKIQNLHDKADEFLKVMVDGVPSYANDPAFVLREYVISKRGESRFKMDARTKDICVAYAWESFRQGKRWGAGVRNVPDNPSIDGWTMDVCFGTRLKNPDAQRTAIRKNVKKRNSILIEA
jgi:hypothetical protein